MALLKIYNTTVTKNIIKNFKFSINKVPFYSSIVLLIYMLYDVFCLYKFLSLYITNTYQYNHHILTYVVSFNDSCFDYHTVEFDYMLGNNKYNNFPIINTAFGQTGYLQYYVRGNPYLTDECGIMYNLPFDLDYLIIIKLLPYLLLFIVLLYLYFKINKLTRYSHHLEYHLASKS